MVKYFNQIRYLRLLITEAQTGNYEEMKNLIKHERQINFSQRSPLMIYVRWLDARMLWETVTGLDVNARSSEREVSTSQKYGIQTAMKRVWNNKNVFFPNQSKCTG